MIEPRLWLVLFNVYFVGWGLCNKYILVFTEGLSDCDGFKNDIFKGNNMDLGKADNGGDAMFLAGHVEMGEPIKSGTLLFIRIEKETELGNEPMWSCSLDVCKSVDDKDAPWAEALKSMNITGCPIETGKYFTEKFVVDISFAKKFLNIEFVANYIAKLQFGDDKNTLSCHVLGVAIKEAE